MTHHDHDEPEQGEPRSTEEPAESGALEEEQEGKGYGADEGEREEAITES
jgi:hypothetical protein